MDARTTSSARTARVALVPIIALLVSVAGALAGTGVLTTLVPIRAELEGFPRTAIGLMGTSYFSGMLIGAVLAPAIVRRLGSIPTYAAALVLSTAVLAVMPLVVAPPWWILLRGVTGFSLAGVYAVVEGYIQASAENRIRGRLLGAYSVMQYGGWAAGGQLMRVGDPASAGIFWTAAVVVMAAGLLPLLLVDRDPPSQGQEPSPMVPRGMDLRGLWRTSPVGFVAVILIGFANGPFWTLTPVFATDIGLTAVEAGTLMTLITIGAAAFQVPVGRLSDTIDRRVVIVGLALCCAAIEVALGFFGRPLAGWPLLVLGFVLGGTIATQYYTASAHTNDRAGPERAISIASALLFLYSVGAITGPLTGSFAMQAFGPGALHLHNLALHVSLAAFVLYRIVRRRTAG